MMEFFQKQAEVSRKLFELNVATMQEVFKHQQEDVKKYFEINSTFGGKLPEVSDVTGFVELQRAYGEAVWNNVRASGEAQVGIVRSAVEEAGEVVRSAFTSKAAEEVA